jgi:hypothetical protein
MSVRAKRFASAGLAAGLLVGVLLVSGMAFANDGRGPVAARFVSSAASRRAARQDVERRIAGLTLPPWGGRVLPRSPLTSPRLRGRYPFYGLGVLHPVWETAFASFRAGPRGALRWFIHHPPDGAKLSSRAAGPNREHEWYRCLWFELPDGRPTFGERIMTMCAVKAHGRTSVRVDAEAVWLEGRSPYERIPRGSRYMEVIVAKGARDTRRAVVADPRQIAHVVDLVNSLPVLQHDTCAPAVEEPSPSAPKVEVLFRSSLGGWPIARISGGAAGEGECPPLRFWLRGRLERPLDESGVVFGALHETIERLRRALGR